MVKIFKELESNEINNENILEDLFYEEDSDDEYSDYEDSDDEEYKKVNIRKYNQHMLNFDKYYQLCIFYKEQLKNFSFLEKIFDHIKTITDSFLMVTEQNKYNITDMSKYLYQTTINKLQNNVLDKYYEFYDFAISFVDDTIKEIKESEYLLIKNKKKYYSANNNIIINNNCIISAKDFKYKYLSLISQIKWLNQIFENVKYSFTKEYNYISVNFNNDNDRKLYIENYIKNNNNEYKVIIDLLDSIIYEYEGSCILFEKNIRKTM